MSETDDLEQQRQELIERIKQVFPKNPPGKGSNKQFKIVQGRREYEEKKLTEVFEGKRWEEMVSYPGIEYYLSELDFVNVISDKAFLYYLPAFLTTTLNDPQKFPWVYSSWLCEKLYNVVSKFSSDELDIVISYFEFQTNYCYKHDPDNPFLQSVENLLLHLLFKRDELAAGEK
jgi:hypothetical protein